MCVCVYSIKFPDYLKEKSSDRAEILTGHLSPIMKYTLHISRRSVLPSWSYAAFYATEQREKNRFSSINCSFVILQKIGQKRNCRSQKNTTFLYLTFLSRRSTKGLKSHEKNSKNRFLAVKRSYYD